MLTEETLRSARRFGYESREIRMHVAEDGSATLGGTTGGARARAPRRRRRAPAPPPRLVVVVLVGVVRRQDDARCHRGERNGTGGLWAPILSPLRDSYNPSCGAALLAGTMATVAMTPALSPQLAPTPPRLGLCARLPPATIWILTSQGCSPGRATPGSPRARGRGPPGVAATSGVTHGRGGAAPSMRHGCLLRLSLRRHRPFFLIHVPARPPSSVPLPHSPSFPVPVPLFVI